MARRAIIIGGGIAGLSAAIALRQAGWDILLYEQAEELKPMGAALSLWPNAMAALASLGCDTLIRAEAQQLDRLALADSTGRTIMPADVARIMPGSKAFIPTRTLLQAALLAGLNGLKPQLGHRLATFSQDANGVSARFDNGVEADGDLLVAADGIWSSIADQVIGTKPAHVGYGGVLALSDPVPGFPSTGQGHEYWGDHERFGLIDIVEDRKYWFYMRNEGTPAESGNVTKAMIDKAMADWPKAIRAAIAATPDDRLIPFSIHARPVPKRLGNGRIVCVGDAAHAMEPNLGQGGCQSLEDAVALGAAARGADVLSVLATYEKLRLARVGRVVSLSSQAGIVPHHLPQWLSLISRAAMRAVLPIVGTQTQRDIYTMPDYFRAANG